MGQTKAQRLISATDALRRLMQLGYWSIHVDAKPFLHEDGSEGSGACHAQPEYLDAVINLNPQRIAKDDEIPIVAHELAHILVWKLADAAQRRAKSKAELKDLRDMEEELTTAIERIICTLLDVKVSQVARSRCVRR